MAYSPDYTQIWSMTAGCLVSRDAPCLGGQNTCLRGKLVTLSRHGRAQSMREAVGVLQHPAAPPLNLA